MSFPSSGYVGKGTEDWARAALARGPGLYDNLLSWAVLGVLGQEAPRSEVFGAPASKLAVKTWPNISTVNA